MRSTRPDAAQQPAAMDEPAASGTRARTRALAALDARVTSCRACPRLVRWREDVAGTNPTWAAGTVYWSKPLAGFGDPDAQLVLVGLAPAAHGGNRTGRMFTGDRSGDFLFAALHRAGYANQPGSVAADDGLTLHGARVTAAVRCAPPANRPTPAERDACAGFLAEEVALLTEARVYVALGGFALQALWRVAAVGRGERRPRFAHGTEIALPAGRHLLCCYHPSQRNVFTGLVTPGMYDEVFRRTRELEAS